MTAKEYLKQYENAEIRVRRLESEYEKEELMIDAIRSSSHYEETPVTRTGGKKSTVEDKVIRLAEKHAKLLDAKAQALEIRQTVFNTINAIPGAEGTVLFKKYIELKKWEVIAVEMNYSWGGIHQLHRRALHLVAEAICV